jgi:hypothetical protein
MIIPSSQVFVNWAGAWYQMKAEMKSHAPRIAFAKRGLLIGSSCSTVATGPRSSKGAGVSGRSVPPAIPGADHAFADLDPDKLLMDGAVSSGS